MQVKRVFPSKGILVNSTLLIIGSYFLFYGLVEAKDFLAPLLLSAIVALLTFPLANKLESKGVKPMLSTSINVFLLLVISMLFFLAVSWQLKSIMDDWGKMKKTILPKIEKVEAFILTHTPMEKGKLEEYKEDMNVPDDKENKKSESVDQKQEVEVKSEGEKTVSVIGGAVGFATDFLICFVYIFFFIHYRTKFKNFLLMLVKVEDKEEAKDIISKSTSVVRHYIAARLFLMVILSVLYALGLWITGVENFIVVSIIAAILSLIPYVGNFLGYLLAMVMGLLSGGEFYILIGITVTFVLVQFLDSYILQPVVLGNKLNVHPFFIIVSVVLGNAVWGIIGMILSIPIFAIISIVCRHVPAFSAFAYLFSSEKETK